jgi:PKD repeat protein
LTVAFSDASTGTITSYLWNFGDTTTSTEKNPAHEYASTGTFTVKLTVTGPGGSNTKTQNKYITVSKSTAPVAGFSGTPTSGVAPLTVKFTDSSTNTPTTWSWSFGDGSLENATQQNPVHTYASVGTYTVSLTATNSAGSNTFTRTNYITVSNAASPVAGFSGTPRTGTAPLIVLFSDVSTGTITSYQWDFGDTATSTDKNPSHQYNAAGTYTVKLTVTGPGGSNTKIQSNYITVNPPAALKANFIADKTKGQSPLTVQFTDSSSGSIDAYLWTFGDGSTSDKQNPIHVYTNNGRYTVQLTVSNSAGSNTMTKKNYIAVS